MSDYQTLRVAEHDDRVVVTLDRPRARNAINAAMIGELHAICELVEQRPRFLLIVGEGEISLVAPTSLSYANEVRRRRCKGSTAACSNAFDAYRSRPWRRWTATRSVAGRN